jgi:hypothetical protein
LLVHQLASVRFVAECAKQHAILLSLVSFFLQVDAAEDMWGSAGAGRSAGGSKMLLEDADADEDDLVVGLGAAAGAAADFMAAAAMQAVLQPWTQPAESACGGCSAARAAAAAGAAAAS